MLENELSSTRKQLHDLEQTTEARVSTRLQQHSKTLEERFENIQMDRADALMAAQSLKRQLKSLKLSSQVQKDNLATKSRAQQRKLSEMKDQISDLSERVRCPAIAILFGTHAQTVSSPDAMLRVCQNTRLGERERELQHHNDTLQSLLQKARDTIENANGTWRTTCRTCFRH